MGRSLKKPFAKGVRWKNGAWRYRVPRWVDDATLCRVCGGKREVTLGATIGEASAEYGRLLAALHLTGRPRTLGELMDRYMAEVVAQSKPASRRSKTASVTRLRAVFGAIPIDGFRSPWAFQYRDRNKHRATTANRDLETLSHLFSKAIEWGDLANDQHPMRGLKIKKTIPARTRYVTDKELQAALALASPFLAAYIRLKVALGLRKADMLRLRLDDATDDGILGKHAKTEQGTVYDWNDERRAAWAACLKIRPRHFPRLLFMTRDGKGYVAEDGTTSGFDSQWQRFMAKVVAAGVPRFTEHDLRAKVATDSPDLETARKRLGHKSASTTRGIYDRKNERAE